MPGMHPANCRARHGPFAPRWAACQDRDGRRGGTVRPCASRSSPNASCPWSTASPTRCCGSSSTSPAAGHEVLVIAPGTGRPERATRGAGRAGARRRPAGGARRCRSGVPSRRMLTALREFAPDVVHLAAPFVVGYRGLAAARRLGIPTVAVYQTDVAGFAVLLRAGADRPRGVALDLPPARPGRPHARPVELGHRGAARRAACRGCTSGPAAWTPAASPRPSATPACAPTLAPGGELLVGYVGRLAPEKQVERLAALAGRARHPAGGGRRRARARSGCARPLPDARRSSASATATSSPASTPRSTCSSTPDPSETFCQAVQEALASGLPVVAPDAGGPRDLVLPGPHRLPRAAPARRRRRRRPARSRADAQLRAAVVALTDAACAPGSAAAARRSVLRRTWSTVGDELLAHYAEVIGATAAAGRLTRCASSSWPTSTAPAPAACAPRCTTWARATRAAATT